MQLYNVPRKSYVKIVAVPSAGIFLFDHIDGMYSYCTDAAGNVVHLAAWEEVEIMEGFPNE